MEMISRVCRWLVSNCNPYQPARCVDGEALPAPPDLAAIRQSMLLLLAPCSEEHRVRGAEKIASAGSAVDL